MVLSALKSFFREWQLPELHDTDQSAVKYKTKKMDRYITTDSHSELSCI
jgi:hypothetical protein